MEDEAPHDEAPEDPVVARVRGWVADQGYPLEYRTAHAARAGGYYVDQSWTYSEAETVREVDVLATFVRSRGFVPYPYERPNMIVKLAIECKRSKNPWMVLLSDRSNRDAVIPHVTSRRAPWAPRTISDSLVARHDRIGVNAVSVFGKEDSPFGAMAQAVSGAHAAARAEKDDYESTPNEGAKRRPTYFFMAVPVVVLGGDLVTYHVDDENQEQISRASSLRMAWSRYPEPMRQTYIVDVVTEPGFPEYLTRMRYELERLLDNVGDRIRRDSDPP